MILKNYQKAVIGDLSRFMELLRETANSATAYKLFWKEKGVPIGFGGVKAYQNILPGVPSVCMKVPTGGGKTYLACNAVKPVFDALPEMKAKVVVWLVPSDAILTQTITALRDPEHPYRQKLDMDFAGRIGIYTKEQLLTGQCFDPVIVMEQVCICVLSYDSFRGRLENLKARQENSNLSNFVDVFGTSESPVEDAEESALFQVLNSLNPLVVIDESHHAKSKLSIKMLKEFNPCFVLELTATPKDNSNIIVYVDAVQLKKESMVKLPVMVYNRNEQAQVIAETIDMRNRLEELALVAKEKTGRYIRPIALFQAEPKGKEDSTTFEKLREKLLRFGIPSQQIAIRTSKVNEIKNIKLMSEDCPIRYIITVNALKEGWDCPFAYILASLANKTSRIDVEQILGRILRLPYTKDNPIPALNMSYVLTSSNDFSTTLESIVKGLNAAGFSEKECRVETNIPSKSNATPPAAVQEPLEEPPQEEQEEFLDFNDADIERVLQNEQNETGQESGRSTVDEMLSAAEQASQNYADTMQQTGASDPNLSWEVKNKMQNFFIKPEFQEEIKELRLPQFVRQIPGTIFTEGSTAFLERESIESGFSLKGKPSDIDFSNADTQMVYVDVRDQSGVVPKVYKMSNAEQQAVKDFLAKASPQARIDRCKKMMYDQLSKMNVDEGEMRQYVNRIVDEMTDAQREGLEKSPVAYALKIKAKIESLLDDYCEKTFTEWLETEMVQCQDIYEFPESIHPAESDSMIGGSLYVAEEAMNGLERELALELTAIPSVRWWHRNIVDKKFGFRINGFINHYPDLIIMTQKGNIVLVETKGEHLKNDDSAKKARLGRAWQNVAGKGYRYYMVFRDTDPKEDGMVSMSDFLKRLQNL